MGKLRKFLMMLLMCVTIFSLCTVTSFGAVNVVLEDYNSIPTLTVGQSYTIVGHIKSNKDMSRVEIGVVSDKTQKWTAQKYDKKVKTKDFDIAKADPYIKFGKLKVGNYKYRIYAHVNGKVKTLYNQSFSVVKGGSDTVKDIQKELNRVNVGTIVGKIDEDGIRGTQTIKAIKFFQQVHGLKETGTWNEKTAKLAKKTRVTYRLKAVNWAVSVANDNSFAYGTGQRAHRCGCFYCKTNTGKVKYCKQRRGEPKYVKDSQGKKHTYTKTYCCNTFITAAYAHGAKDATIYKVCARGSCCGMSPSSWTRSKYFKTLGRCKNVPYSKIQAGDILLTPSHVFMFIGHGRIVEASGGNWSASSISVKSCAKARYDKAVKMKNTYIMRYTR